MEKQRVIFDLDGTLLTNDPGLEREYFEDVFGKEGGDLILSQIPELLGNYENRYPVYDTAMLARYLTATTGFSFSPKIIEEWVNRLAFVPDEKEAHIDEVLDYLKSKDMSLAVLTNWFAGTQIPRLKKAGLLEYFDQVYTGELFLKPHKEAFYGAIGSYQPEECIFIGDSVERDYIGPKACGMDAILYDKRNIHHKSLVKVRNLNELKSKL